MANAPDTCTFKDRVIPRCGISIHASVIARISGGMPSFSAPRTRTEFDGNAKLFNGIEFFVCSIATIE